MTDGRKATPEPDQDQLTLEGAHGPSHLGRREFLSGAAALAAGGLGVAGCAQPDSGTAASATPGGEQAVANLDAQTEGALRWAGPDRATWVRPGPDADHHVVIVGGGQSGVAIAYGLRRKGVGGVQVIDQSDPGRAGIWRTIARMQQLRTPKTLPGLEQGNPMLSFRAWYETLNGPAAFDALDRIPRVVWADYLDWFQQATVTEVRYRTRLIEIEPQGDLLRLHLESEGVPRVETTRKLVLANGIAGAGGPNVPGFLRDLPPEVWSHSAGPVPFDTLGGKVVGVLGAGASAFDAAAVALESGASEVHLFSRRPYVDYPGSTPPMTPAPDRGHSSVPELTYDLPDVVRWRTFLLDERRPESVPRDSIERVMAFVGFRLHLNSPWSEVAVTDDKVVVRGSDETWRFDYVIAGTGYQVDLSAQRELARIHESISLWRDRYQPEPGEENDGGASYPYLGAGFEFLPRRQASADYLRNIHCFNLAASLSYGKPVGDVPSAADHPRLISAVARDLYLEGVDTEVHERFINAPLVPADPAPYQQAVEA